MIDLIGSMTLNLMVLIGAGYLVTRLEDLDPHFRTRAHGALFGLVMGAVATIVMLGTAHFSDGMLIDLRSVVLVMSGFFGGPVAAFVTMIAALFARIQIAQANYALVAVAFPMIAAVGVGARMLGVQPTIKGLIGIGVALAMVRPAAVVIVSAFGWLDASSMSAFLTRSIPATAVFFVIGVAALGMLLRFETNRSGKAAELRTKNRLLEQRDQKYQSVFDLSTVAMMWLDAESRISHANKSMTAFVGRSAKDIVGLAYEDLLAPDEREDYRRVRSEYEAAGIQPKDSIRRFLRKDGEIVWGMRSTTLVHSDDPSEPPRRFVMIQDITDRKRAERQVRFQADLLESVEEAVIAIDLDGAIIFWNRYAEKLFGWPAGEVTGRDIGAVLPSLRRQFGPADFRERVDAGRSWSGELEVERRDGATLLVRATSSPVNDPESGPVAMVTVAADVTDEKQAQLALLEEQRTLEILSQTAGKLNAEIELEALLQTVADVGVELTGADFGAFYSGQITESGVTLVVTALSGIDRATFDGLALPGGTALIGPVFGHDGVMRCDDVRGDARFKSGDALGSYLILPLLSRDGARIGALFLGHRESGAFAGRIEQTLQNLARQAAVAVERANLFRAARQEIETRRKAEEKLEGSRLRFRDFAEVGSDLLWETDAEFRITSIVGDSRAVFGLAETEMIGRTAWEIAKADLELPEWKQHQLDCETHHPFRNFEYPIIDRGGATRWISTNGRPYFDHAGSFLGFRGSSSNIAARKHAEAKLAASARQQQSAAVLSQLALQGVPRDDLYQVAVELVARTLGVELAGILELSTDKRVLRLRAGVGWPAQSVNVRAVPLDYCPPLARGISSDVPVHFSRRNFNLIPGLQNDKGSGVALPIGEKAVRIGVLVVCSDGFRAFSETDINFLRAISFVLAADAEQRKAAATLRLRDRALEASGEGIMITDASEFDNPVIYVNPAFERLTGYSKEETVGRNARFLQGPDTDKSKIPEIRGAIETESTFRGSILNYRKDGTSFWNGLSISPIRDESGATTHFVGILSDETESIQLASRLRQAQKMEALGHLTGGVAHDFNNLLAVILGNSEILYDGIDDEELRSVAELVMTTAEKGADLTQRLLAFGRRQPLHPEALDLGGVVASLSDMLNRTVGTHITFEIESKTDRPAFVDKSLFEAAILNLVLNARDAMPSGGTLKIETSLAQTGEGLAGDLAPGDYVCIAVKDTGVGMADDVLDRAFDPFFSTKGIGKGSGMGLSMVYGFAKQSGGHVSIESRPEKGTTVYLYLPLATKEQAPKRIEARAAAISAPTGGHERILLVEDEPQVRRFVSTQLAGLGYAVLEAEAGAPALEILQREPEIDLLFTDLIMPGGMSGFDLVEQARRMRNGLKVLLTTGYADEADSLLANVKDPILKKPYKKQQLAEALREVLERAA